MRVLFPLLELGRGALEILHDRDGVAERVRPGGAAALRVPAAPLQAEALPARALRFQGGFSIDIIKHPKNRPKVAPKVFLTNTCTTLSAQKIHVSQRLTRKRAQKVY